MLWQNDNASDHRRGGKNAWRECDIAAMERDRVLLARRPSGRRSGVPRPGQSEFFLFFARAAYDVERQLGVVLSAVRSFGVAAEMTGRKRFNRERAQIFWQRVSLCSRPRAAPWHPTGVRRHGTGGKISECVAGEAQKQRRRFGARPAWSTSQNWPMSMSHSWQKHWQRRSRAEYGPARRVEAEALDLPGLEERAARYASWEWNFARSPRGEIEREHRFAWGGVQILFSVLAGNIVDVFAYTDAMDENFAKKIRSRTRELPFPAHVGGRAALERECRSGRVAGQYAIKSQKWRIL